MEKVIHIWDECNLSRGWNNPKLDNQRRAYAHKDLFFVVLFSNKIIVTAMFGYDEHRGCLNFFALLPQFQKSGFWKRLLEFGELILW